MDSGLDAQSTAPPESEVRPCNPLVSVLRQQSGKSSSESGWSWLQKKKPNADQPSMDDEGEASSPEKPSVVSPNTENSKKKRKEAMNEQPKLKQISSKQGGFSRQAIRQNMIMETPASKQLERLARERTAGKSAQSTKSRQPDVAVRGLDKGLHRVQNSVDTKAKVLTHFMDPIRKASKHWFSDKVKSPRPAVQKARPTDAVPTMV